MSINETDIHSTQDLDDEVRIPIRQNPATQEETVTQNEVKDVIDEVKDNNRDDDHQKIVIRALRDRSLFKPLQRYEANLIELDEPTSYEEAVTGEDAENWKKAINEELKAHELNGTWTLQDLPKNKKTIESKWVFKIKHGIHGDVHQYKTRLCAKGYSQKQGVDYQEVFAPVA